MGARRADRHEPRRRQWSDAVRLTPSPVTSVNRIVSGPSDTAWPAAPEPLRSWTHRVARPSRISWIENVAPRTWTVAPPASVTSHDFPEQDTTLAPDELR